MKIGQSHSILPAALSVSLALHAVLLIGVRIVAPDAFHPDRFADAELVEMNGSNGIAPMHVDLLAQVDNDGGGNADAGHAKSPLPDMHQTQEGDALRVAKRRMDELEAQQNLLMSQAKSRALVESPKDKAVPQLTTPGGIDDFDSQHALARKQAEIAKEVDDYNKRPRKVEITPSTRRVEYAVYYAKVKTKIEKVGTLHFPSKDGRKLYGKLILSIPISQDGSLYMADGGPVVMRSSGNSALDRATLKIVRDSAPFPGFHRKMAGEVGEVWEVNVTFIYSREEGLTTDFGIGGATQ